MGRHKPGIELGGRPIVARVLDAVAGWPVVVAGSGEGVPPGVRVVSEDPPGGGPVAGLAAGWAAITDGSYAAELGPSGPDLVVVLAGDLPLLTRAHVDGLAQSVVAARPEERVAVSVSSDGPNWLCAAWPAGLFRARLAAVGDPAGVSVRRLLGDVPKVELRDLADVAVDVDTPEDLARARRRLGTS
jgi:molybdopterin-guanine dinucleotide biosynthesis protein A